MRKGSNQTKDAKRKIGEASLRHWKDSEFRRKQRDGMIKSWIKRRIIYGKTGFSNPEEHRKNMSESRKRLCLPSPMKGKHHSKKTKENLREKTIRQWEQHKLNGEQYGMLGKHHTKKSNKSNAKAHIGKHHSEKVKKAIGKASKERWRNPEYKQRVVTNTLKGNIIKPNRIEKKLDEILQLEFPNEYHYVGDGMLIIGGKCPDFVDCNGKKRVIELFGDYWHKGDNPQDRIDFFRQYGYDCLVIWEHELSEVENLTEKILEFQETQP